MSFGSCVADHWRYILANSQLSRCTGSWDMTWRSWHSVLGFQAPTRCEPSSYEWRARRTSDLKLTGHQEEHWPDVLSKAGRCAPTRSWVIVDWSWWSNLSLSRWWRQIGNIDDRMLITRERVHAETWNLAHVCKSMWGTCVPKMSAIPWGVSDSKAFECRQVMSKKNTDDENKPVLY